MRHLWLLAVALLLLVSCRPGDHRPPPTPGDTTAAESVTVNIDSLGQPDTAGFNADSAEVIDTTPAAEMPSLSERDQARFMAKPRPRPQPVETTATPTPTTDTTSAPMAAGGGIPFGGFGLWADVTTLKANTSVYRSSIGNVDPGWIAQRINAARTKGLTVDLFMTGGDHSRYKTNGKFDPAKWKARLALFNTSTIKNAVAAGVADGTIIGCTMLDEPEIKDWGGVITKPMLNQLASYQKGIFPTCPAGINHGPPGYQWRSTERYSAAVDYVNYQYAYNVSKGDVALWRGKVLYQAKLDGVRPAFSLNLLDGGNLDTDGAWNCPQSKPGTYAGRCWMTASQVQTFGLALVPYACKQMTWTYNASFLGVSANMNALKTLAAKAASLARPTCKRP